MQLYRVFCLYVLEEIVSSERPDHKRHRDACRLGDCSCVSEVEKVWGIPDGIFDMEM